jgi:hypothetical protein
MRLCACEHTIRTARGHLQGVDAQLLRHTDTGNGLPAMHMVSKAHTSAGYGQLQVLNNTEETQHHA